MSEIQNSALYHTELKCQRGRMCATPPVGRQLHLVCRHVLHVGRGHCEQIPQPRSPGCVGSQVLAGAGTGHLYLHMAVGHSSGAPLCCMWQQPQEVKVGDPLHLSLVAYH